MNKQIDLRVDDVLNIPYTGSFCTHVLEVNDTHFRCGCVSLPKGEWTIKNTPWIDKNVIRILDQSSPEYDARFGKHIPVRAGSEYEYWISPELVFINSDKLTINE